MNQQSDESLVIGKIIEVNGSHIIVELDPSIDELSKIYEGSIYPIGQFGSILKIYFGRRIIYAHVSRLRMKDIYENEDPKTIDFSSLDRIIEANLFGEGEWNKDKLVFERGVSTYPLPQQKVYLTTKDELAGIFEKNKNNQNQMAIGEHVGMTGISAYIDLNELLNKHSAILGSTGSGKSGTVTAIIQGILKYHSSSEKKPGKTQWHPNIFILDPHNEYSSAFDENNYEKLSIEKQNLKLPYWLFNLQETIELLIGKTASATPAQANIIKKALLEVRKSTASNEITVDSPIPYDLEEFKKNIDSDKPPQESKQESHLKILHKLELLRSDSRYNFIMENWQLKPKNNDLCEVIKKLISGKKHLKIIDLSGIPNEIAGIVSAVIARILFSIKIWQTPEERAKSPILLICEEAHRYIPAKGEAQYKSAQEAVKRIAKEGRKYGIGLMLVSQRPSEVEATVLSQCNSWIVLRTTNETDTSYIKSMIPDSLSTMTQMLSTLRRREALVIGQAITVPARILIKELQKLPRSGDIDFCKGWESPLLEQKEIETICNRWKFQNMNK